jgi:ubiquinone/menaquinone biosynthesis C-methylase UbiE
VSELHPATRGFAAADRYERGRPDYPEAAVAAIVERLGLRAGRTVLDLAAGTGKLTRLLVPSGAAVVAVEPVREMRERLERLVPGATVLAGTAERIPLAPDFVDGVTVGQAFHWFDELPALHEMSRVLRAGGGVALVWNARDERNDLQAALTAIIDPLAGGTPRRTKRNWRTMLAESGLFERCDRKLFSYVQQTDEQGVVDRVASISFVAAAPQEVRDEVEGRVRALVRGRPEPLELPYMTEVYFGFKPLS